MKSSDDGSSISEGMISGPVECNHMKIFFVQWVFDRIFGDDTRRRLGVQMTLVRKFLSECSVAMGVDCVDVTNGDGGIFVDITGTIAQVAAAKVMAENDGVYIPSFGTFHARENFETQELTAEVEGDDGNFDDLSTAETLAVALSLFIFGSCFSLLLARCIIFRSSEKDETKEDKYVFKEEYQQDLKPPQSAGGLTLEMNSLDVPSDMQKKYTPSLDATWDKFTSNTSN